jgi:uncharacterized membrane-anchored protein
MQQRPLAVTIFGILNIGFGALGVLGLLVSMVMLTHIDTTANPVLREMYSNPTYVMWMKISLPFGGVVSVALLVAGIGLLFLKNWARVVSLGYGVYTIITGIIGGCVMIPVYQQMMAHTGGGPSGIIALGSMIGGVFGLAVGMAYPILLIIFMTRPKIVAAFRPAPLAV